MLSPICTNAALLTDKLPMGVIPPISALKLTLPVSAAIVRLLLPSMVSLKVISPVPLLVKFAVVVRLSAPFTLMLLSLVVTVARLIVPAPGVLKVISPPAALTPEKSTPPDAFIIPVVVSILPLMLVIVISLPGVAKASLKKP